MLSRPVSLSVPFGRTLGLLRSTRGLAPATTTTLALTSQFRPIPISTRSFQQYTSILRFSAPTPPPPFFFSPSSSPSTPSSSSAEVQSGLSSSWNPRNRSDKSSSSTNERLKAANTNLLNYLFGIAILVVGASWGAVPLYRIFCAHTGFGGTTQDDKGDTTKLSTLQPSKREIRVQFNADVSPAMHWKFVPSQPMMKVRLGEPVLAFFKATNNRDKGITGVATYNVTPLKTGQYFHKIQCFCFDEQRLRAKETVDMPVFFYIDPALENDPKMNDVTDLTLSYTFFPVDEDDDDTRSDAEKDAQAIGVRTHGATEAVPQTIQKEYEKLKKEHENELYHSDKKQ